MRAANWREGSLLPESGWWALSATAVVSLGAALWVHTRGRGDLAADLLLVLAATAAFILLTAARWEPQIRAAAGSGDWSEVAFVGLSFRAGPRLLLYGVAAFVVLWYFAVLPQLFLGVPEFAFAVESAFGVVVLAPLREEIFVAAVWGFVYCAAPRGKWFVATAAATGVFLLLHTGTYSGASTFAWMQLVAMRVTFAVANWLPTFRGHPPSLLPGLVGHLLINAVWYLLTCAAGDVSTALATALC